MSANYERNSGRELVGIIIILIGFGLLLNTLNFFPGIPIFSILIRFWLPAMFIGIGALILSRRGPHDGLAPGLFFIVLGLMFMLSRLDFGFNFSRWIGPAILIWIGFAFLTRSTRYPRSSRYEMRERRPRPGASFGEQYTDSSDFIHATAILGGFNRKCMSQQFRGGDLTAIMAGGKIDLRDARIPANEAILDVLAIMGGIDIQVPADWVVEPRLTPILGAFADRRTPVTTGTQRLVIHGTSIMGGVTVSN